MSTLARRRLANTALLAAAVIACLLACRVLGVSLRPHAFYSGIALLLLLLLLALFNARKKLPFLPLLKASHWLQFHIYAGFLSIVLFGLHTGFRMPHGTIEVALALLFAVVSISGVVGLAITRMLPRIMAHSGEPLTYEKIPAHEIRLRREAEGIVAATESETGASALGDAYLNHLSSYFRPRSPLRFFLGNPNRFRLRALDEIKDIDRCTGDGEREALRKFVDLIDTKHNLDIQKSSQFLLRCWLFIHIPFTYSMLIVAFVHAWVALSYTNAR